jgi:hypothetical protein
LDFLDAAVFFAAFGFASAGAAGAAGASGAAGEFSFSAIYRIY